MHLCVSNLAYLKSIILRKFKNRVENTLTLVHLIEFAMAYTCIDKRIGV